MAGMTAAGIGSGLDLESLMKASINAERQPQEQRLQQRRQTLDVTLSAVGSVKSALSGFRNILDKALDPQRFLPRQALIDGQKVGGSVTPSKDSSASDKSTATTTPVDNLAQPYSVSLSQKAVNGTYDIEVLQLAKGSRLTSNAVYKSGKEVITKQAGQITLEAGKGKDKKSFNVDISAGMTIDQLRKAINENSNNFGVTANLINSESGTHLVLDSSKSGLDDDGDPSNGNPNDLIVTTENKQLSGFVSHLQDTKTAAGAKVRINGLEATSETNQFKDLISGVNLTVNHLTSSASHLKVEPDIDGAVKNVHQFVDAYNKVITQIDKYSKSEKVQKGGDNSNRKPLSGDAMLRTMRFALGKISSSGFRDPEQTNRVQTLYGVGIKMDRDGKLSVDDDKLKEQLQGDMNQVGRFFASKSGVADRFSRFVKSYEQVGGILSHREQTVQTQLKGVREGQTQLDDRMAQYEKTLREKYTSFDQSMAGLKEQMNYVQSHL
ncbi:flagellar filament capping protein FliD [Celerinatantimonas yamalensis]|uniref:Flagellar hook-associated protein 2 n=1 Tax=Celerinatantimonas yamalensis TaxID=559956 RepID=A0ABW9G5Y3_9GAMM